MGLCMTIAKDESINTHNDESDDDNQRKAQQLALEEEMEKLRRKQSAGWELEEENETLKPTNTGQTKTIEAYDENTFNQLQNMGFNEYIIKQAFKYSNCGKNNANLLHLIEWIEAHHISTEEIENHTINSICKQLTEMNIKCNRLQAIHALDDIITLEEQTSNNDKYVIDKCVNYLIANGDISYQNLSNQRKEEYTLRDQILIATIQSIEMSRKDSLDWRTNKPFLMAELRSMGFLQTVINNALNSSEIKDKKSAIKWIMNNPLSKEQELSAKIEEIIHSGFTDTDAEIALEKFENNLRHSLLWLNQNKADKINHYLYHFKTQKLLQIRENRLGLADINFGNESQKWSIWDNGKIKNFHCNKILTVKCVHSNKIVSVTDSESESEENMNETNPFLVSHDSDSVEGSNKSNESNPFEIECETSEIKQQNVSDSIKYEICIVSESVIQNNNNECLEFVEYLTNWTVDNDEKIMKMKVCGNECFLYLVHRNNKLSLDTTYVESDMQQRWCVLSKIALTELNPKELAKELDDPDAECLICFDSEPNVILDPCGHNNFCKTCMDEYKPSQCPICRTTIKSVLQTD